MKSPKAPVFRAAGTLATATAFALAGCSASSHMGSLGAAQSSRVVPTRSQPSSSSPASPARRKIPSPRRPSAASLTLVHDPGRLTGSLTGRCRTRDNGRLPDRHCTPGAIDPAVTQGDIKTTICLSGYTETVRAPESQTESFKFGQAYPAYGIATGTEGELDHLVPLELGGANDAANLWPETGPIPNPKDSVENALNRAVCDGQISLARAQSAIARNWETAESRIGLSAPAPSPEPTKPVLARPCTASVSSRSPADYTTVYIYIRTAAGASVTTVAHYKTTNNQKTATASDSGQATVAYHISGATPGYTVTVDITTSAGLHTAACSTSFTPTQ